VMTKPRNVYEVGQGEGSNAAGSSYHECVLLVLATDHLHDINDEFEHDRPDIDPIEAPVIQ
jgi:GGDEF domain-containing protein